MTVMWHAASVTVTNGDDRVVINSNESTSKILPGAEFNAANFALRYEVLQVDYDSNLAKYVIVLGKNWGGPSGDVEASVAPSALEMSRAADALEALNESYANIADLLRLTAEPGSIPQRDSNGRLKAAAGSASDDVVTVGQFEDLETYQGYGLGGNGVEVLDFDVGSDGAQFMRAGPSAANLPPTAGTNNWAGIRSQRFSSTYFDFWA